MYICGFECVCVCREPESWASGNLQQLHLTDDMMTLPFFNAQSHREFFCRELI